MVSPSPSVRVLTGGAERLLSVRQVAEHFGVCTAVVYRLVERGDLPHVRVSNAVRIAPADLAAFVARRATVEASWAVLRCPESSPGPHPVTGAQALRIYHWCAKCEEDAAEE